MAVEVVMTIRGEFVIRDDDYRGDGHLFMQPPAYEKFVERVKAGEFDPDKVRAEGERAYGMAGE